MFTILIANNIYKRLYHSRNHGLIRHHVSRFSSYFRWIHFASFYQRRIWLSQWRLVWSFSCMDLWFISSFRSQYFHHIIAWFLSTHEHWYFITFDRAHQAGLHSTRLATEPRNVSSARLVQSQRLARLVSARLVGNTDRDTIRRRMQRGIQSDSFYIDPTTDANIKARLCQAQKEKRLEQYAEEREDILSKIQQRHYDFSIYIANVI